MKKTLEILTPEKALLNIKNTAISTRVGDFGIASTYVKDLSSTQQPFAVLDLALTELAEIKQRAEEYRKELGDIFTEANADNPYSIDGDDNVTYYTETEVIELIDYILKGETK